MAETVAVEVRHAVKEFGQGDHAVRALDDVSVAIRKGEFFTLLGPSGCGKTTLLRLIAGFESPTSGQILLSGADITDLPPNRRPVNTVFQSYALYPHMTVRDNMSFALKIAKKSPQEIEKAVENAARILQLTPYLDRLPKALSGGQRQRVAIGRAIVRDPKVYLFDEPLSNLDAALRVATRIEIAQLKEAMPDRTMVYVTHDQVEAMTLASRIVVLAGGGIAQVGTPLELYERPRSEFVAQFIGSPSMNLLDGAIEATGAETVVRLDGGGTLRAAVPTSDADKGLRVRAGVRPEDFVPTDAPDPAFRGRVEFTEALGEVTLLYFGKAGAGAGVIAKLPGIHADMRRQEVALTASPGKVHLFHEGQSLLYR